MIKIVATQKVKADKIEEFRAAAKELIKRSREEEGNVFYGLHQSLKDPTVLAFIECWKDQAAIEAHNATEHFKAALPKLGALCEAPGEVTLYNELD